MEPSAAIDTLSALAQPTRLEIFRLLVRQEPHGLPAGEVARRLGVPHNTLSTHLSVLVRAGLVSTTKHSRSLICRAELGAVKNLVMFLLKDCCDGQPELCSPLITEISAACSTGRGCCS